jgi:predicted peptidase
MLKADRNEAVLNAPGSSTSNISQETVTLIADRLKSKYNYDQVFRQMHN